MDHRRLPSLAERVNWLFSAVVEDVVDQVTGETSHRGFSSVVVGRSVAAALRRDVPACVEVVRRLQSGVGVPEPETAAFAAFFGVPASYLTDDDPDLIAAVEAELLEAALRGCQLEGYRVCRASPTEHALRARRASLLEFARAGDGGIVDPPSPRTPPCDDDRVSRASAGASEGERMGPDRAMSAAELAAFCAELVWSLDMRPPLDPHEMCRRLAKTRGRKITVVARDLGGEVSIGHLKAGPRGDRIGHDQNAPTSLAAHVIFHEVIHLVRGHLDGPGDRICGTNFGDAPADVSLYADWTEWEAEAGATYLSEMSRRRYRPRLLTRDAKPADHAIAAAFGLIRADRRS